MMRGLYRRIKAWLQARLTPGQRSEQSGLAADNSAKQEQRTPTASYYKLGNILSDLNQAHLLMRPLKKCEPDLYSFHEHVGARLVAPDAVVTARELSPEFREHMPAMGLWYLHDDNRRKREKESKTFFKAAFFYFEKTTKWFVDASEGETYRIGIVYSRLDNHKMTASCEFFVSVDADGNINPLKQRTLKKIRLPIPKRGKQKGGAGTITQIQRGYPDGLKILQEICQENGSKISLEELAVETACTAMNFWETTSGGWCVRTVRDGVAVTFSLHEGRCPYFFSERITAKASDGRRRRVFHAVRRHARQVNGKTIDVKTHYRGERYFKWNGFDVQITVPDYHGMNTARFNIGGYIGRGPKAKNELNMDEVGEFLADAMDSRDRPA